MGKLKQKAPVEDNNQSIGFLDLSAELRNQIYELCLVASDGMLLFEMPIKSKNAKPKPNQRLEYRWAARALTPPRSVLSLSPNLLAVCKTIHGEATPMLYGCNRFHLNPGEPRNVELAWLAQIGDSIEHVRKIGIGGGANQRVVRDVLESLEAASSLEKLFIHWSLSHNFRNSRTMATGLFPLMLHLHRSRKDTDSKATLDVLEFEGRLYYNPDRLQAEVKAILKKRLKC